MSPRHDLLSSSSELDAASARLTEVFKRLSASASVLSEQMDSLKAQMYRGVMYVITEEP